MPKQSQQSKTDYDVLIIGGGMVGASLAVALLPLTTQKKLRIGLVDAFEFGASAQPSYDDRAIALSYGSSRIFSGMGLWNHLEPQTTPIYKIHISDRGHFGAARLSAEKEQVPALGYLVESRVLGKQLYDILQSPKGKKGIKQIIPASVIATQEVNDTLQVTLLKDNKKQVVTTKLLVAADGTQSKVRELAGIGIKRSEYHQAAVVANVSTEKPHNNEAFERFADTGPIALLPMSDNRCSLVWTHDTKNSTDDLDKTLALNDDAFLQKLGDEFGYRLGKFIKVGQRSSFPLALVTSDKNTAAHTVIIGNASHTMHPVAGQGLNLAMRDIAVLADLVAKHASDLSTTELLETYEKQRKGDVKTTVRYTDSLVRLFSNDNFFLGHARAGGLLAVDRFSPLRKLFTRQSMGVNYRQSRLARGLALRAEA